MFKFGDELETQFSFVVKGKKTKKKIEIGVAYSGIDRVIFQSILNINAHAVHPQGLFLRN